MYSLFYAARSHGDMLHTTAQEMVKAKKIKNHGTSIVQVGIGNIAAPIEKVKAPVAIGPQARAYYEMKRTNFLDTIKNYGTVTVTILFLVIIFIGYRYTR